ncbi:hypothetical protein TREES_T100008998 [Tupaia chinensis]|uniref:Uncharacterized protein n=1 Tax=Tupaia chinensis TaxID=246437 RepID=L9KRV8_TUPCH|nr:hypothetical protein TREES_T100008998 [Tupaia chinensis]
MAVPPGLSALPRVLGPGGSGWLWELAGQQAQGDRGTRTSLGLAWETLRDSFLCADRRASWCQPWLSCSLGLRISTSKPVSAVLPLPPPHGQQLLGRGQP